MMQRSSNAVAVATGAAARIINNKQLSSSSNGRTHIKPFFCHAKEWKAIVLMILTLTILRISLAFGLFQGNNNDDDENDNGNLSMEDPIRSQTLLFYDVPSRQDLRYRIESNNFDDYCGFDLRWQCQYVSNDHVLAYILSFLHA